MLCAQGCPLGPCLQPQNEACWSQNCLQVTLQDPHSKQQPQPLHCQLSERRQAQPPPLQLGTVADKVGSTASQVLTRPPSPRSFKVLSGCLRGPASDSCRSHSFSLQAATRISVPPCTRGGGTVTCSRWGGMAHSRNSKFIAESGSDLLQSSGAALWQGSSFGSFDAVPGRRCRGACTRGGVTVISRHQCATCSCLALLGTEDPPRQDPAAHGATSPAPFQPILAGTQHARLYLLVRHTSLSVLARHELQQAA